MVKIICVVNCDTDKAGNIINGCWGINAIPDGQYEHSFLLKEYIDLLKYRIVYENGKTKLVKKGGA